MTATLGSRSGRVGRLRPSQRPLATPPEPLSEAGSPQCPAGFLGIPNWEPDPIDRTPMQASRAPPKWGAPRPERAESGHCRGVHMGGGCPPAPRRTPRSPRIQAVPPTQSPSPALSRAWVLLRVSGGPEGVPATWTDRRPQTPPCSTAPPPLAGTPHPGTRQLLMDPIAGWGSHGRSDTGDIVSSRAPSTSETTASRAGGCGAPRTWGSGAHPGARPAAALGWGPTHPRYSGEAVASAGWPETAFVGAGSPSLGTTKGLWSFCFEDHGHFSKWR